MSIKDIKTEDYKYDLPQDRIAIYPLNSRDDSKLLIYRDGKISDTRFYNLPDLLPVDSLLIWNNSRVIPARLEFQKSTGSLIEIFLLEPVDPPDYAGIFAKSGTCSWNTIIGNQKKWKGDRLFRVLETVSGQIQLSAEQVDSQIECHVRLTWTPEDLTFGQILEFFGKTPIPPYLKRDSNPEDKIRYQTVYANFEGSVAAPTAGLHFTPELIEKLRFKNIRFDNLTLHVGSGTFIPVKSKTVGGHLMHAETVILKTSTIRNLSGSIPDDLTVVGTTSLRSLESLFWIGQKLSINPNLNEDQLFVDQWEPYSHTQIIDPQESLKLILRYLDSKGLVQIQFMTRLMIVPGYHFKFVRRLITNFHQPSSTLLLLVSAFIGKNWRDIYNYALENEFRFLSYGDSSLLEIQTNNHG